MFPWQSSHWRCKCMVNRTVALIIRKTCQLWWFNWLNYGTEILLHAAPRGGRLIWLKLGALSYYGDLCNMPMFQLHCSYLGWVFLPFLGSSNAFFIAHFGHFSILWLQCQGYLKPNINSLFIITILKGFVTKHMDQRNISVVCEIIVKLMLLKAVLVKLKITQI